MVLHFTTANEISRKKKAFSSFKESKFINLPFLPNKWHMDTEKTWNILNKGFAAQIYFLRHFADHNQTSKGRKEDIKLWILRMKNSVPF